MTTHSAPTRTTFSAPIHAQKATSLADIATRIGPPDFAAIRPSPRCESGYITVYLAGSPAIGGIAQKLGVYLVKIGATTQNPGHRIAALSKDRYAGQLGCEGNLSPLLGADAWRQFRLSKLAKTERDFVTVMPTGDIRVKLPSTAPCRSVEAAINVILGARSFDAFLGSIEGQTRCAQAGIDPKSCFWTAYSGRAPARTREIFLIDPRRDGDLLLDALDALAARFAQE